MLYTLGAVFFMFSSVMLVITTSPVVIEDATGRSSDAGFVTAVFSAATVLTDLFLPRLLRMRAASWFLALGTLVIAASAPLFAMASESGFAMLAAAGLRGVGFGFGSVTASLFVVNLAPVARRGRALGYYGLATTIPAMAAPAAGLVLLEKFGIGATYAVAAVLAGFAALSAAAGRDRGAVHPDETIAMGRGLLRTLSIVAVRRPFVVSLLSMFAFGGLLSFVPLRLPAGGAGSAAAFFLVAGLARATLRWVSGGVIDRIGPTGPLVIGMISLVVGGVVLLATPGVAAAMIAAVALGAGHGFVLNAAYLAMIKGGDKGNLPVVSTLWNLSLDGGAGLGALVLGVVAAFSVDAVFVVMPVLLVVAVPVALRAHAAVSREE